MNTVSKKKLALAALIFAFTIATVNAQIPGNLLGQTIHQTGFGYVPENEFNRVFEDFLGKNYPRKNSFSRDDVADVTEAFALYVVGNATISAQWKKYAEEQQARQQGAQQAVRFAESGDAYYSKKDYDRAIADYTQAIRLNPSNGVYYNNRGLAYQDKKDYDRAIADFTEAIRLDPRTAVIYLNRGHAYRDKEDYDRAIADYTEAIRLDPNAYSETLYTNRGFAYYMKSDYAQARSDINRALRINSNSEFAKLVDDLLKRRGY